MHSVISDTSCLILLDNTGLLFILEKLYGRVLIITSCMI